MIVCPKCGYENLDNVLYCNLCKEIFQKEKKQSLSQDKITSFSDLPENVRNLLLQQKKEIMNKEKTQLNIHLKKGCLLFAIIGIGIFALILLRFFFTLPGE